MANLTARVRPRPELGESEIDAMYSLFSEYYDAAPSALFRSDLDDKDYVIELRDGNSLRGFSTVALMEYTTGDQPRRALFSGDTIVDHRFWGEQALTRAFCRLAGLVKAARPELPLDWFLISKGYRTYRFLSLFAMSYFPNPHGPTPPQVQARINELARMRFGTAYRGDLGLVRFPSPHWHLRPYWANVREGLRRRPEVSFFLERNPGFHAGDEPCCITPLEVENLRSLARKAFVEGLHAAQPAHPVPEDRRRRDAVPQLAAAGAGGPGRTAPDPAAA